MRLLGHVDDAHAPFADLLQQLVGADHGAGAFGRRRGVVRDGRGRAGCLEEVPRPDVGAEQRLDLPAERGIAAARPVQVGRPLGRGNDLDRLAEDGLVAQELHRHGSSPPKLPRMLPG